MRRHILSIFILAAIIAGCTEKSTPTLPPAMTRAPTPSPEPTAEAEVPPQPWWRNTVFYEIFVRSFYDSNGDGNGDFNGLTQKLDYLNDGDPATENDLGITGIWLMPIHPSPSYHGYDVLNYYAVNPEYGTMEEFKAFLAAAHQRGIKVIIDLVLNHTSNRHPFFVDASSSESSPYHDWYIWSPDAVGNGWYPLTVAGKNLSYYGYFCDCMPDLNYQNPSVSDQMEQVTEYWLNNVGVDGFRIDAAKHLIENGDANIVNSAETHTWFKSFYTFYKGISADAYAIGEVTNSDAKLTTAYAKEELDQIFNFELASGIVNSVRGEAASGVKSAAAFAQKDNPSWDFGTFLTNHDQNRVMNVLGGNVNKAKLAAFLLLTSPGTPFLYYGEEIGMTGQKPDEDIRRPMQWDDGLQAGFSTGIPWEEVHADYMQVNVREQIENPDSLLSTYQKLITLRNKNPAIALGTYNPVDASSPGIYAFLRQEQQQAILILANLTKNPIQGYTLKASSIVGLEGMYTTLNLMDGEPGADLTIQAGKFLNYSPTAELGPYTGYIFSLGMP